MRKLFLLLILGALGLMQGLAQAVSGRVLDPDGVAIPYVRIFAEGQGRGVLSNAQGEFSLSLSPGSYRLVFRHLSYAEEIREIELRESLRLEVILQPVDIQLEEVDIEIGKKDPAYAIMKQVIAHKKTFLKQFDAYSCQTYLKISLEADTLLTKKQQQAWVDSLDRDSAGADTLPPERTPRGPVTVVESQSRTYFKAPNAYKSIVDAYRAAHLGDAQSPRGGNGLVAADYQTLAGDPYVFYQDVSEVDMNFYQNLIEAPGLSDRPLVSPLNGTLWQLVYTYKLEERRYEEGNVVYKIRVAPKNNDGPYFDGHLYVEDETWALKAVELSLMSSTLSFFRTFALSHRYEALADDRRVLNQERYLYEIKDGRAQYYGQSIALHGDYELDPEFPRNFFRNELRRTDKEAFERDSSYWAQLRPIKLRTEEAEFYQVRDSIKAYHRSKEYLHKMDSTFNHTSLMDVLFNGISWRNRFQGMEYYFSPVLEQMQFLGVGGYRHNLSVGVTKTWRNWKELSVWTDIDYGVVNKDVKGGARIHFAYAPRKLGRFSVRFGDQYDIINDFETVTAILSRSNFIRKIHFGLGNRIELANGLVLRADIDFADRQAIDDLQLADWSNFLFGELNTPRSFDPYREAIFSLTLSFTPGQKYYMEPFRKVRLGSKWPTFSLFYKKAVAGIFGSELNYDFLELRARHEFLLGTLGTSRWTLRSGKFLQSANIRFTDFKFFRGSDPFLFVNPLAAFQLLGPTISTRNAYLQGNYIHDFNGNLMDKIPLIKRTDLQSAAGAGVLLIQDGSFAHGEVYAGLQYPFRIRKQRFKVGVYYVTAYSNYDEALRGQVKMGVSFFNPVKNQWSY